MKRKNSRQKGAVGERRVRDLFREAGFTARRTQQYSGTEGTSDVLVEELPMLHIESKYTEKKAFLAWLAQAERDAAGTNKIPLVIHFRNYDKEPIAILRARPLIDIIRRSDLVQQHHVSAEEVSRLVLQSAGLGNTGI